MPRRSYRFLGTLALVFGLLVPAGDVRPEIINRIAAVVEGQVVTTSAIERIASANLIPVRPGESAEDYRRRILEESIEFILQRRDAERFGLKDVHPEDVDARIERRMPVGESREQMLARLAGVGMNEEELRSLIQQRLQVEAYIQERFAPLIFVSLEEIEVYYHGTWSQQKRDEGESVPPLAAVREQLRELLRAERLAAEVRRWTDQLRLRANVDIYAYQ